jgi:radical SAM superfamily enzyme YgiQ (UPF0313 family)
MKVLLIYPPFCTPASAPFSITNIYSFLKNNSSCEVEILDLNLEFHTLKFPKYQKYFNEGNWGDYESVAKEYSKLTRECYSSNNKAVIAGENPEFFNELIKKIKDFKPDVVAFSVVYSSQVFYAYSLIKGLKGFTIIVGGPAVNDKLVSVATKKLGNELELLEFVEGKKVEHEKLNFKFPLDFSKYSLNEYFSSEPIIPLKTSTTCFYKGCAFCSHFTSEKYYEYNLEELRDTIIQSKQKNFFLIDDMVPVRRLLKLAEMFKPLNIKWACQLRPTCNFTFEVMERLKESGLTFVIWGVESANDRVLKLMRKGTNVKDVSKVLENSKRAGVLNITYIMFGFPTETKEELLDTVGFLKRNKESIDLVSLSVFGLQEGTEIYRNPEKYGVSKVVETKRTMLGAKITYEVSSGLSQDEAIKLKKKVKSEVDKINKIPERMNFFREHVFSYKVS